MMGSGAPALVPFLSHVSIVGSERPAQPVSPSEHDERLGSHARAGTNQEAHTCNGSSHAGQKAPERTTGACYTAALLKSTLLLMGCKPRVAHKVWAMSTARFVMPLNSPVLIMFQGRGPHISCPTVGYTFLTCRPARTCSRVSQQSCQGTWLLMILLDKAALPANILMAKRRPSTVTWPELARL